MSFLAWIVLGVIAGFVDSKIVNKTGEGILLDIVLGIVGAVIGGWLFKSSDGIVSLPELISHPQTCSGAAQKSVIL